MLVQGVENVAFDELAEIELANGEKRRCRVLKLTVVMHSYSY
jgi:V/A-type H+-transporting ATPase subunit B